MKLLSFRRGFFLLALARCATASAAPNLVTHVEQLAMSMLPGQLVADPRLERGLSMIVARLPAEGPPPNELIEAAMWQNGLVEPVPQLVVVTTESSPDAPDSASVSALDAELRQQLPAIFASGHFRRVAAATYAAGGRTRLVIALQESFIELDGATRELRLGGVMHLRGRLLPPYGHVEGFATLPTGQVTPLLLSGDANRFVVDFRCTAQGRQQIEITGAEKLGPQVLANFPLYCGEQAPIALPADPVEERPVASREDAEQKLLVLVNADRRAAQLAPLQLDDRLTAIARAHSVDMRQHGFVGHVSPTTGSAADRLHAAGVGFSVVAENVARAYAPAEAERGLMDSPGHRANLLNRQVTRIGIGVALAPAEIAHDGATISSAQELYVTQLFVEPAAAPTAMTVDAIRRTVQSRRQQNNLRALTVDSDLDGLAARVAGQLATGVDEAVAGRLVDAALATLASRYAQLRTVETVVDADAASSGEVVGKGAVDAAASAFGVGLARGKRDGRDSWFIALLIATPQKRSQ